MSAKPKSQKPEDIKPAETKPNTSATDVDNTDTAGTGSNTETGTNTNTDTAGTDTTGLPATVKVMFNKNVRYNRTSFVDGDIADVPAADYEQMTEHCSIVSESAE